MDTAVLDQKIAALAREPGVDAGLAARLRDIVAASDDWGLFRVNPLRFAAQHGMEPGATLDLFLHAVRVGLFDFAWCFVCPMCGGIEHSHQTVGALVEGDAGTYHCTPCDVDAKIELDEFIEVSFTVNASVRALHLDMHADRFAYERYFRTVSVERSPQMQAFLDANCIDFRAIGPGRVEHVAFAAAPGTYRLISQDVHDMMELDVAGGESLQHLDVQVGARRLTPRKAQCGPGEVTLHVHNRTADKVGVILFRIDREEIFGIIAAHPNQHRPSLTGKMLLNNQTFREQFRTQSIGDNLRLQVRSLTILFTDLKGSTAMYDRVGDLTAYSLVRDHFALLRDVVRRHAGAIVKTMGDAIMATFSTPDDGVAAAVEMMTGLDALNARWRRDGLDLGLKVGLHEGPALVIDAEERLDYFGQTVNIAARVQGLASAGEIWLTEAVHASDPVRRRLQTCGLSAHPEVARLKGVGGPVPVFRCTPTA